MNKRTEIQESDTGHILEVIYNEIKEVKVGQKLKYSHGEYKVIEYENHYEPGNNLIRNILVEKIK